MFGSACTAINSTWHGVEHPSPIHIVWVDVALPRQRAERRRERRHCGPLLATYLLDDIFVFVMPYSRHFTLWSGARLSLSPSISRGCMPTPLNLDEHYFSCSTSSSYLRTPSLRQAHVPASKLLCLLQRYGRPLLAGHIPHGHICAGPAAVLACTAWHCTEPHLPAAPLPTMRPLNCRHAPDDDAGLHCFTSRIQHCQLLLVAGSTRGGVLYFTAFSACLGQ